MQDEMQDRNKAWEEYKKSTQELWKIEHSEEFKEARKKKAEEMDKALTALEETHKDRGLVFYNRNGGSVPMQFYGEIDGLKLYWRTRGNYTSLRIGPYDPEKDKEIEERRAKARHEEYLKHKKTCTEDNCFECLFLTSSPVTLQHPEQYYPPTVTKHSFINEIVEGDTYKGDLDPDEIIPIFEQLLEKLSDVDDDFNLY